MKSPVNNPFGRKHAEGVPYAGEHEELFQSIVTCCTDIIRWTFWISLNPHRRKGGDRAKDIVASAKRIIELMEKL